VDLQEPCSARAVYAPAATVWAPAVATLGISEAEPISRRTAAVSVLVADGVSAVASGIPAVPSPPSESSNASPPPSAPTSSSP